MGFARSDPDPFEPNMCARDVRSASSVDNRCQRQDHTAGRRCRDIVISNNLPESRAWLPRRFALRQHSLFQTFINLRVNGTLKQQVVTRWIWRLPQLGHAPLGLVRATIRLRIQAISFCMFYVATIHFVAPRMSSAEPKIIACEQSADSL